MRGGTVRDLCRWHAWPVSAGVDFASSQQRGALAGVIVGVLVICWMTFPAHLPEALRSPFHAHMITVIGTLTIFGVGVACSRAR